MDQDRTYELALMQTMTDQQRLLFTSQMESARKSKSTALLLALFLGGLGAHRFYLGQVGLGVLYAVFCWLFIPAIIALFELFVIGGRVERYNQRQADAIAAHIRLLTSTTAVATT